MFVVSDVIDDIGDFCDLQTDPELNAKCESIKEHNRQARVAMPLVHLPYNSEFWY